MRSHPTVGEAEDDAGIGAVAIVRTKSKKIYIYCLSGRPNSCCHGNSASLGRRGEGCHADQVAPIELAVSV